MEYSDLEQKKIFAENLKYYVERSGKDQKDIAYDLQVNPPTFSQWATGKAIPSVSMLKKIADYFNAKLTDLVDPHETHDYYLDPETAKIAQEVFENPDTRMLFDAARDCKPEDIRMAAEMLKRFKETNPDG